MFLVLSAYLGSQLPPSLTKRNQKGRTRKPSLRTIATQDGPEESRSVLDNDAEAIDSMSKMDYIFFDISSSDTDSDMDDMDWIP